jgi:F-type H+-transporting ATPase subunit gamma
MKMVAASKLRRAQDQAQKSQPYARAMSEMMLRVAKNVVITQASSKLLVGTGSTKKHLLVVVTADRGLCGGFNSNLVREVRRKIIQLKSEGKDYYLVCVGRKGRDLLRAGNKDHLWQSFMGITAKTKVDFIDASEITQYILGKFETGEFDICTLAYNSFESVLTQKPTLQQIIPFDLSQAAMKPEKNKKVETIAAEPTEPKSPYDFEPEEEEILNALLPRNISVQIYRALLDSSAGEQAARMTAMDSATRNAGERIKDLSLQYNRARQAYITKELIEIISGAEAL